MLVTETPVIPQNLSPTGKESLPAVAPNRSDLLAPTDSFARRHIGPGTQEIRQMLEVMGFSDLDALIDTAVPKQIRLTRPLQLPAARGEHQVLADLRAIAVQNQV